MKIEKLTENKIRILLKNEDIKDKDIDLHTIMTTAVQDSGGFLLEILNLAEKEVGFNTDGYKLLIEAYSSPDNDFVFTITKYLEAKEPSKIIKKSAVPRRKIVDNYPKHISYNGYYTFIFNDFESFCELCTYLENSEIPIKGLARQISLHKYNDMLYLLIDGIKNRSICYNTLFNILSEFSKFTGVSPAFKNKLSEHGNTLINHNALQTGIKYFA